MTASRLLSVIVLVIALPLAAFAAPEGPKVGDPAPDFTLTATDSLDYTLSNYQGKVVLLMIQGYG